MEPAHVECRRRFERGRHDFDQRLSGVAKTLAGRLLAILRDLGIRTSQFGQRVGYRGHSITRGYEIAASVSNHDQTYSAAIYDDPCLLERDARGENGSSGINPSGLAADGRLTALRKGIVRFAFARQYIDLLWRDARSVELDRRHCGWHPDAEENAVRCRPDATRGFNPSIVRNMATDEIDRVDLLILRFRRCVC